MDSRSLRPASQDSLSVTQLLALAKNLLEEQFLGLWVEGEVSGFRPAPSGHWYFVLKDANAELKVAMFRSRNLYAGVKPQNGMRLRIRGRLTVYESRGELQMVAEQLEDAGAGAAAKALEQLKAKLAAEGLFASEKKRVLPKMPRRIALLSSPHAAAVHDFLVVLARRFPLCAVEIWPVLVQGEQAPGQIIAALQGIARLPGRYDLAVLTRGGGSAQDLACFNDEALVRAVAASSVPLLCAVGHEIDVSLCDFAADVRAATPTAAAELIGVDVALLAKQLARDRAQMQRATFAVIEPMQQRLDYAKRLLDAHSPVLRLLQMRERLQRAAVHLQRAQGQFLQNSTRRLSQLHSALQQQHPQRGLSAAAEKLELFRQELLRQYQSGAQLRAQKLALMQARVGALSPIRTLERGYVLVRAADQSVLSSVHQVPRPGQVILSFHDGEISAHTEVEPTE